MNSPVPATGTESLPLSDEHGLVRWAPKPPPAGPRTVADVLDSVLETDPGRLAVVDDDVELTYNDLIVRGGANVYPAEVEQALCTHPDVAEAAVVGRPDERLGEIVVAVVRVRQGAVLGVEELRAYCAERLARYKVPAEIRFVSEFPRNAMGKVIKKALRAELEGTGP